MTILERYELILEQAMEELGPIEIPEDRSKALELQGDLAPDLGDVLYRLCIEHAAGFTPFKETVIGILANQRPVLVTTQGDATGRPFACDLEPVHSLILLALEMMPVDTPEL